jgi:hypothetical protein
MDLSPQPTASALFDKQFLLIYAQEGVLDYFIAFFVDVFNGAEVLIGAGPFRTNG